MSSAGAEAPILFSGPLVRAILASEKTQTRRLPRCSVVHDSVSALHGRPFVPPNAKLIDPRTGEHERETETEALTRIGAHSIGTRLWVRETWTLWGWGGVGGDAVVKYAAGGARACAAPPGYEPPQTVQAGNNAPSIFMPRWASRLTLEITDVRLERLQAITDADIRAEGIVAAGFVEPGQSLRDAWATGWDRINGGRHKPERPTLWASNPWVIAYDFRVIGGVS